MAMARWLTSYHMDSIFFVWVVLSLVTVANQESHVSHGRSQYAIFYYLLVIKSTTEEMIHDQTVNRTWNHILYVYVYRYLYLPTYLPIYLSIYLSIYKKSCAPVADPRKHCGEPISQEVLAAACQRAGYVFKNRTLVCQLDQVSPTQLSVEGLESLWENSR